VQNVKRAGSKPCPYHRTYVADGKNLRLYGHDTGIQVILGADDLDLAQFNKLLDDRGRVV
jgi:hypothetical protein